MKRFLSALVSTVCLATLAAADNWPGWRGPHGDGRSDETKAPLEWDKARNVLWKQPLPYGGNSCPVIWGDRVFLTGALDSKGKGRATWCFDRKTGNPLWKKVVEYNQAEPTHKDNLYCSATPVTDGKLLWVSHGSAGLYCYDFDGNEKWKYDLGKLYHIWGNASSPILYGDLCILWCGPGERQFLLAVNKKTGEKVWQRDEEGGNSGNKGNDKWLGSWTTPIVVRVEGHDELIVGVPRMVKAFDPKTGDDLWFCEGLGPLVYTTPVATKDGIILAQSGYGGPALAVKAGGKGDVTKTHRLWHHTKGNPQRIGSGVIVGEHFYLLNETDNAICLDIKSGKEVGRAQLPGKSWSSMVLIGERIYVLNHDGDCYVVRATPKMEQLAVNSLEERTLSSVAIADGQLFIRTYKHLWCIGEK